MEVRKHIHTERELFLSLVTSTSFPSASIRVDSFEVFLGRGNNIFPIPDIFPKCDLEKYCYNKFNNISHVQMSNTQTYSFTIRNIIQCIWACISLLIRWCAIYPKVAILRRPGSELQSAKRLSARMRIYRVRQGIRFPCQTWLNNTQRRYHLSQQTMGVLIIILFYATLHVSAYKQAIFRCLLTNHKKPKRSATVISPWIHRVMILHSSCIYIEIQYKYTTCTRRDPTP
jgi:hypothetical protein